MCGPLRAQKYFFLPTVALKPLLNPFRTYVLCALQACRPPFPPSPAAIIVVSPTSSWLATNEPAPSQSDHNGTSRAAPHPKYATCTSPRAVTKHAKHVGAMQCDGNHEKFRTQGPRSSTQRNGCHS